MNQDNAVAEALAAEVARLQDQLVLLQGTAERAKATFRERLGERDRPTWFAVNALQDFADFVHMWIECHKARDAQAQRVDEGEVS